MPIYRYRCTECGAHKEHLQKVSDPPIEICDSCGGALAKQMTAAAFHLKGGGWYKDLYSSSKPGAETSAKPDSSSASTSDSSSSSGSTTSSTSSSSSTGSTSSSSSASSSAPSAA